MKIKNTEIVIANVYECPNKQYIENYRQTILRYFNSKVEEGCNIIHRNIILQNFQKELNKIDFYLKN